MCCMAASRTKLPAISALRMAAIKMNANLACNTAKLSMRALQYHYCLRLKAKCTLALAGGIWTIAQCDDFGFKQVSQFFLVFPAVLFDRASMTSAQPAGAHSAALAATAILRQTLRAGQIVAATNLRSPQVQVRLWFALMRCYDTRLPALQVSCRTGV